MIKTNFRSEKMNSSIRAWENEKKMQAKLKMEKRKVLPQLFLCSLTEFVYDYPHGIGICRGN